jgi:hypothetical protein
MKNFLNLPMHNARIPPVDPAPATNTAVLAMHTGHMCLSSELLIAVWFAATLSSRCNLIIGVHNTKVAPNVEELGVTSVAGFQ